MKGQGTQVFIGAAKIGKLIGTPALSAANVTRIETTTHDDSIKTFVGGLLDNGDLSLTGQFAPADLGQNAWMDHEGETMPFSVLLSDGTTFFFDAVVGKMYVSAPIDGVQSFTCTAKITGDVSDISVNTSNAGNLVEGDITFTAIPAGAFTNNITVELIFNPLLDSSFITVNEWDITIHCKNSSISNKQLVDFVNASSVIIGAITGDPATTPTAFGKTNLIGGLDS